MDERATIERAVRAWAEGDDKAFWRLLAPDVEYSVIGTTPVSGSYAGRRAFFDGALLPMGALLAEGTRPLEYDIIAEGSRVVLMWRGEGVMTNGAPYNQSYCWVMEVRDGQVRRLKAYLDTALVSALFAQGERPPEP
jgi:ketosteroid isomerase-like protein